MHAMKPKLLLCMIANILLLFPAFAADEAKEPVRLMYPDASLELVLMTYSHIAKRRVWLALGVHATVSVVTDNALPHDDALAFIRTTLLEHYGIEIRDKGEEETFVSWTSDPKYIDRIQLPRKPDNSGRPVRIVPIQPAGK